MSTLHVVSTRAAEFQRLMTGAVDLLAPVQDIAMAIGRVGIKPWKLITLIVVLTDIANAELPMTLTKLDQTIPPPQTTITVIALPTFFVQTASHVFAGDSRYESREEKKESD